MNWTFTLIDGRQIDCMSYVITDGIAYLNVDTINGGVDTWEYAIPIVQILFFKHA